MSLKVNKGNCPCSLKQPERDGVHCELGGAACHVRDSLMAEVEPDPAAASGPAADSTVTLELATLEALYGDDFGDALFLVCSPRIREHIRLEGPLDIPVEELVWKGASTRSELIGALRALALQGRRCSVLWMAEDEFEHYQESELANAKLAAISFFSNPFSPQMLSTYLRVVTATSYRHELEIERQLLSLLDSSRRILFRSPDYGAEAAFEHHETDHWFSLHGPLGYGQQTVLPTGELAVLTNPSGEFTLGATFSLSGTIVIKGHPILHRGGLDVSAETTSDTFRALRSMRRHAIVASVSNGTIESLSAEEGRDNPLLRVFESVIEEDPRYRKIHEIGFGTNATCAAMTSNNFFGNERWPGLHCGLGLGGYTPFHIDLALTEVDVYAESADGTLTDVYALLQLPHRTA